MVLFLWQAVDDSNPETGVAEQTTYFLSSR
jgi:hypothetical protein